MIEWNVLQAQAAAVVAGVSDDPDGRVRLRETFYAKYGGSGAAPGLGASEIAFLRWEVRRGVLNSDTRTASAGSPWWRAVNSRFLFVSQLAALAHEAGFTGEAPDAEVSLWLEYLRSPTPTSWYRAHNASIVGGYLRSRDEAGRESRFEQVFMNIVLYRLLFAQAMVEGAPIAFGPLGKILADPRLPSVNVLVDLPDFYPEHYPLTKEDIADIMERGHSLEEDLVRVLDDDLVIPHLRELYRLAALWNGQPELPRLLRGSAPIYPRLADRRRVAVLGGGVGAMATVFALTDPANPDAELYDVTVYQLGWRLGGKGASGRALGAPYHARIQEHGLHIWFGFYDNAFKLMRDCYGELGRPNPSTGLPLRAPDAPLANWQQAFVPHGSAFIMGEFQHSWRAWYSKMPTNDAIPGEGGLLPLPEYLSMAVQMIFDVLRAPPPPGDAPAGDVDVQFPTGWLAKLQEFTSQVETVGLRLVEQVIQSVPLLAKLIDAEGMLVADVLKWLMEREWQRVRGEVDRDVAVLRQWITLNFGFAQVRGIFADRLVERGFDSINDLEYREWLRRHAIDDGGRTLNSAFVQSVYDGSFAYVNGDNSRPNGAPFPPNANMEAGTTLRAGLRLAMTYKGAPVWRMQAGMGDTVFGPMYEVLRARGVRFEFFHRVRRLEASDDGRTVARVVIGRQATVTPEQKRLGGYAPLVDVKGLPCWPSEPRCEQLIEGGELRRRGVNLEEYCADWKDVEEITLTAGREFDSVVLGISLGAIPYVAGDLVRRSSAWKVMVDRVRTIRTQGVQFWLRPTASQLGWSAMQQPVLSGYDYAGSDNPLETWGDMSHLRDKEGWPIEHYPLSIAYFCSSMLERPPPETPTGPMPTCDDMDQRAANAVVRARANQLLEQHIEPIFPRAVRRDSSGRVDGFRWELLVDARDGEHVGPDRLDAQWFVGNVQPSERYVLTVAGSSRYRLPAHSDAEFVNLFLSGDWTNTHLNYGCVESAAMGGLLAAHALCAFPSLDQIVGLEW